MNQPVETDSRGQPADPREISKWALAYGQTRMIPFLVFMVIFLLLCAALGVPSYLAGQAYRSGNMVTFGVCIAACVAACVAIIYFSVPRWGGKQMEQMAKRLYGKEGQVAVSPIGAAHLPRAARPLIVGFLACVVTSVILGLLGYIPSKYMQPVSALYVVPFLVILLMLMRPAGPGVPLLGLLWPFLYAVHAILIVAGAPILFTEEWQFLNMLIPTVGYGLLFGLVGHAYNRFALRKLKRAARAGLEGAATQGEPSQS